ncbi:MAG: carbonic anhydrase family protein [Verrucomicrobiota bacterium]
MKTLTSYELMNSIALQIEQPRKAQSSTPALPVTAKEQSRLTPNAVLEDLLKGNKRFVAGRLSDPNIADRIKAATHGQFPKAVILSCLDSRVPVEQIFDQGIGDVFVGRVAGNIASDDQLGSMEFATKVAGAKLVMVLGHEGCGAVKGACDGVKMGNLTGLLERIQPAVNAVGGFAGKERSSENNDFVEQVVAQNVRQAIIDIRRQSTVLAELEQKGQIKIVGALYSLQDGSVELLE